MHTTNIINEKIIEMHEKGMTDREMAREVGISYPRIAVRRKRLNFKPNTKTSVEPPNISKETAAYFAGLIDGEGTISIKKGKSKGKGEEKYIAWKERITLKMKAKDVIQEFNRTFRGSFRREKIRDGFHQEIKRELWVAELTDRNAVRCLLAIEPYLRIKKKQCDAALKLRESKDSPEAHMRGGPAGVRLSKEVCYEREKLYREIKALNLGGDK